MINGTPTSEDVYALARECGMSEAAADRVMDDVGIIKALETLQRRLDVQRAREAELARPDVGSGRWPA